MAAQRDYYADLELPRDADINDIKKQFRKLGRTSLLAARDICLSDVALTLVAQLSNITRTETLAENKRSMQSSK